jgi:hypothetical protein
MLMLFACASPAPEVVVDTAGTWPCSGEPVVTWDGWGRGFSMAYCDACHAADTPDRHGAPDAVTLDTIDQWRALAERVRIRTIDDADMPPGGGVLLDDLATLDVLLRCGL